MAGFIEDFYYGNIETQNHTSEFGNELKKKLGALTALEKQLSDRLTGEEKELFLSYVEKYNEFNSLSVADSFINAFRISSKFTYDMFVR